MTRHLFTSDRRHFQVEVGGATFLFVSITLFPEFRNNTNVN